MLSPIVAIVRIWSLEVTDRADANACCNKHILKQQPDFAKQKYLVQETIEAASDLCLLLPKFQFELKGYAKSRLNVRNFSLNLESK